MPKLLNSRRTVVGSLLGVALLGGGVAGVAFAYPEGSPLTVAATATPTAVTVTVTNPNPGCDTQIDIDGTVVGTIPASHDNTATTQTQVFTIASSDGRHKVGARTLNCVKGQKEHAHSRYVVADAKVTGDTANVPASKTYRVDFSGFPPGDQVTVSATLVGNANVNVSDVDAANSKGEGKAHFKFPQPGTYTILALGDPSGAMASYTVVVH